MSFPTEPDCEERERSPVRRKVIRPSIPRAIKVFFTHRRPPKPPSGNKKAAKFGGLFYIPVTGRSVLAVFLTEFFVAALAGFADLAQLRLQCGGIAGGGDLGQFVGFLVESDGNLANTFLVGE